MGKIKEMTTDESESLAFDELQKELLKHKYLYYVKFSPIISDYDYDMLERKSFKLAQQLGFRADSWEGPEENEKHHIHWMVDFDENHPLAKTVIEGAQDDRGMDLKLGRELFSVPGPRP